MAYSNRCVKYWNGKAIKEYYVMAYSHANAITIASQALPKGVEILTTKRV